MRDRARVVIVGGGVAGTSIAYHLAQLGWDDVVLLDRDQLTSGSTFHSAGLVGQLRSSVTLTRMMMYGTDLYRRLGRGHGPRSRLARGRVVAPRVVTGAPRGAHPSGRLGGDVRPPARADLHRRRPRAVPRPVRPGRRSRRRAPPDRRPAQPVRPHDGARRRRTRAAASRSPRAPGSPGSASSSRTAVARVTHVDTDRGPRRVRGRGERRRDLQPRDRTPRRSRRAESCRWPTSTRSPDRAGRCHATCRRCATPTASCTSARRSAG